MSIAAALNVVRRYASGGAVDDYTTRLLPHEESDFQSWKQKYAPHDSGRDYDLRGAYKAGLRPDPLSGHWPDTFKKPNHPTFSDQSIYAKDRPDLAGTWEGDQFIPPVTAHYAGGGSVDTNPTPAQREAGNYKKRHITFQGLDISIENPKGSIRRGVDDKGKPWSNRMAADYGYIKRTEGKDGDQVDAFVGPFRNSDKVFIIDQLHHHKEKFDEHKCLLGFNTKKQALTAYHHSYGRVYGHHHTIGAVTELSIDAFKEWLKGGGGKEPVAPDVPKYQSGGAVPDEPSIEDVPGVGPVPRETYPELAKIPVGLAREQAEFVAQPRERMEAQIPQMPETGQWTEEQEYLRRAGIAQQAEKESEFGRQASLATVGTGAFGAQAGALGIAGGKLAIKPHAANIGKTTWDLHPDEVASALQTSGTKGTSAGGIFTGFSDGVDRYVKVAKSLDHAKEEVLASKLYELAGVRAAKTELTQLNGKPAVASQIIPDTTQLSEFEPHQYAGISGLKEDFPAHAWLANWDAPGVGSENPLGNVMVDGQWNAHYVDFGGALRFRGLGGEKGDLFGPKVTETKTMLGDTAKNPLVASVFKGHEINMANPTAQRIANISNKQIGDLLKVYGPSSPGEQVAMFKKLVARRDDLAKQYGITPGEKPHIVGGTDYMQAWEKELEKTQQGTADVPSINEPPKGQETYWNDKTHQYQNTQPPKTEASFTPNEVTSLMKLNKLSSPAALVHSVMNHTPLAALKQQKITAKQNTLIAKHFDNADPKAVWEAMKDLSPEQISNLKQWFPVGMAKKLKEVQTGQKATPGVSFISDDPNEVADMMMTTHNWNPEKIANSMYQMSLHKDPQFMDSVFKHLTHDIQPEVNHHITDLEAKGGKGEPTLSEQELYESKQAMQHAHEAAIASGETGAPYGLSAGIKYSKKAPLPNEAFHMMDTYHWQQYTPKLTKGKSEGKYGQFGKESYYYEVPKLKNITRQQALEMGFNPDFTIFHATKQHRGATYYDPYPTKFSPYEELVSKTSEPAVFGADIGQVGHSYGEYAYPPKDDPDYHQLPPKKLVGEYIYRPPTGKVAEVNWEQINHFKSYEEGTMSRLIHEAKKRDLDMVIAHHISDLGSNNHTQYIILRPEGLRSLEAKFSKQKLSLPHPHYSIAGATVLVGAAEAARRREEGQYAAGGSVKSTKETANYRLGTKTEHCAICTMFRAPDSCTAVQGKIRRQDTCDYFEKIKGMARGGQTRTYTMPLKKGSSKATISQNISEFHTGPTYAATKAKFGKAKADKQAIAVAMSTARKYGKGKAMGGPNIESMIMRGSSIGMAREGMIHSTIPGRTDKLPMNVRAGSYVLPADIPSALGQGNSMSGGEILKRMFNSGPYGLPTMRSSGRSGVSLAPRMSMRAPKPSKRMFADGGEAEETRSHVPIIAAGGEFLIAPDVVKDLGHGNINAGHRVLDKWVLLIRKKYAETLKKLPGPKR